MTAEDMPLHSPSRTEEDGCTWQALLTLCTVPVLHVLIGVYSSWLLRRHFISKLGKRIHTNLLVWWRETFFRWLAAVAEQLSTVISL